MIKITGFQDYIGMIQIKIMEGKSRKKKPLSDKKCRFSGLYRYRKKNMKKKLHGMNSIYHATVH
jgi:hypothetical protein